MRVLKQGVTAVSLAGVLLVSCAVLVTACGSGGNSEDEAAKSLLRKAIVMMDSVYPAIGTYAIDDQYLSDAGSGLTFIEAGQHVVRVGESSWLTNPGRAAEGEVSYFGDAQSYSILTITESGGLWGVYVDGASDGGRYFCSARDGALTEGW